MNSDEQNNSDASPDLERNIISPVRILKIENKFNKLKSQINIL